MTRKMTIASRGGSLTLDGSGGVRLGLKFRGSGLPPVGLQWFEGAGEGASLRGGRTLARVLDLPIKVYARSRGEVDDLLQQISKIFTVQNAPVTLTLDLDGERWTLKVARTGGGDWDWAQDTDGETFLRMVITAQTDGSPYWIRENSTGRDLIPGGVGIGLLGPSVSLAQLRVANMEGLGTVQFQNVGDVDAYPTWTLHGPFTGFSLVRDGLALTWTGAVATGERIVIDTANGTILDQAGVNRYGGLGAAPKFWTIPEGESKAQIVLAGAGGTSRIEVNWHPRRLAVF